MVREEGVRLLKMYREFLKSTERNMRIAINIALARSEWVLRVPSRSYAPLRISKRTRSRENKIKGKLARARDSGF